MARRTYGAEDARTHLPEILERAHRGQTTLVTKRGKPYAMIAPPRGQRGRAVSLLTLKGSGRGLWGRRPAESVARMREEWP